MQFTEKKVVCFGGGTGLPALLSGLKRDPWLQITAVVNMFDTGGSSGNLKDRFGILPPGDVLKCLLALSKNEEYAREMLLTRIDDGKNTKHTGGNIMLLGLENVYNDYQTAIDKLGKLLHSRGHVVPVTTHRSELHAYYEDEATIAGETLIDKRMQLGYAIEEVYLDPPVHASPQALEAIKQADLICVGPGSFWTSVMPNFEPIGIRDALRRSRASVVLISNIFTEGLGMQDSSIASMVKTVEHVIGQRPVKYVVANSQLTQNRRTRERYKSENKKLIPIGALPDSTQLIEAELWIDQTYARHDSARLGAIISWLARQPR